MVSIGRLNTQKGFDLAIQAAKIIEEKGVEFTWFIIGEGEDEQMLREQIKKERLNDSVKLIGIRKIRIRTFGMQMCLYNLPDMRGNL